MLSGFWGGLVNFQLIFEAGVWLRNKSHFQANLKPDAVLLRKHADLGEVDEEDLSAIRFAVDAQVRHRFAAESRANDFVCSGQYVADPHEFVHVSADDTRPDMPYGRRTG